MFMKTKNEFIKYVHIFITAFLIIGISFIPSLIFTKGIWIYYGDFNVQQIPFYYHVHEAVRNGNFLYDWSTDLGGSFVGCYSFYLYGSPFFWLSVIFPNEWMPWVMPWLTALKYAVMAITAYAYMRKHLKTEQGAFIAALLYAFSGYNGAVLVYNHFHDVLAFFPLYLLLFERAVEKKKRLGFALMTTMMLIINYYFFVGEAVFLIIYFVTMYCFNKRPFKEVFNDLCGVGIAAVGGVLLAGVYILPAIYYTMGNSRLSQTLIGYDLVAYSEPVNLIGILKSIVMLPDVSGLNSAFNTTYSRVSGVAGYIPFFSVAGVVGFYLFNRDGRKNEKRLLTTCAFFAAIPVLNSLFSALNSEYYARWFYMPVLIMAYMTASVFEEGEAALPCVKRGANMVGVITGLILLACLLPAKNDDDQLTIIGALKNPEQLISEAIFSVIMVVLLFLFLYIFIKKGKRMLSLFTIAGCFLTTITMFICGTLLVDMERKDAFIEQVLEGESPLPYDDGEFYRIETEEDFYNYPMYWNGHSVTSFISTIPFGTLDFYESQGIPRKVTSNPWTSRIGVRALLSAKYFIKEEGRAIEYIGHIDDMTELKGYELQETVNDFSLYRNKNYIPMGFWFDDYITETEFNESEMSSTGKDRVLVKAIIISEEDAKKYGHLMYHDETDAKNAMSLSNFYKACDYLAEHCCDTFETSNGGFEATIDMPHTNLVFFSVPWEKGFTAFVDGEETEIVKADFGFMAVCVPEGEHTIEFTFLPSNLKVGAVVSAAGLIIILISSFLRFDPKNLKKDEETDEILLDSLPNV